MTCLAVSGCAHCPARPERLGRICLAFNNLLVLIGLLCATAPLPLSGQKKSVYAPAGRNLLRMPGLAAAAQKGPRVLFAPSGLHPIKQLRRERYGNARRLAQLDETKPVSTGRTKRPLKRRFSFVPGAARFLLPRQKKMWGAWNLFSIDIRSGAGYSEMQEKRLCGGPFWTLITGTAPLAPVIVYRVV